MTGNTLINAYKLRVKPDWRHQMEDIVYIELTNAAGAVTHTFATRVSDKYEYPVTRLSLEKHCISMDTAFRPDLIDLKCYGRIYVSSFCLAANKRIPLFDADPDEFHCQVRYKDNQLFMRIIITLVPLVDEYLDKESQLRYN
jgi:hypothetical protein